MSIDSKELILFFRDEINKLRTDPRSILPKLKERSNKFTSETVYARSDISNISHRTEEGLEGVKEAMRFIETLPHSVKPLELSVELCEVAYQVGKRLSKTHKEENLEKHEVALLAEMEKLECKVGNLDAILEYGFRKDREILATVVVDDGNEERSRREALMNEEYKFVGIGVHEHSEYDYSLLILLADSVENIHKVAE